MGTTQVHVSATGIIFGMCLTVRAAFSFRQIFRPYKALLIRHFFTHWFEPRYYFITFTWPLVNFVIYSESLPLKRRPIGREFCDLLFINIVPFGFGC